MFPIRLQSSDVGFDSLAFFDQVIDVLFKLLIFFVVLVLAMGLVKMFLEVWSVMARRGEQKKGSHRGSLFYARRGRQN